MGSCDAGGAGSSLRKVINPNNSREYCTARYMKQILTFQLNDLQRQQSNDNNKYIDFSIRSFDKMEQTNMN
jgi:hypothetical protein